MSDWKQSNVDHRDFKHGKVDPDDFEDTKYKKKSRKGCKRAKGEPCLYKGQPIKSYPAFASGPNKVWNVMECSRCGKHKWFLTSLEPDG